MRQELMSRKATLQHFESFSAFVSLLKKVRFDFLVALLLTFGNI
jgi:hypothetical protein